MDPPQPSGQQRQRQRKVPNMPAGLPTRSNADPGRPTLTLAAPAAPAGVDFAPACDAHDTCYFTLGSQRGECDRALLQALLAECRDSLQ